MGILQFSMTHSPSLYRLFQPHSSGHRDWLQGDRHRTETEPIKTLVWSGRNGGTELSDVDRRLQHLGTLSAAGGDEANPPAEAESRDEGVRRDLTT